MSFTHSYHDECKKQDFPGLKKTRKVLFNVWEGDSRELYLMWNALHHSQFFEFIALFIFEILEESGS